MTNFDKIIVIRLGVKIMNYEDLGHKLKVERTRLKYNQTDVAYEVGVGQRYLSKIEHGLARPEFEKVFKIARVLNLSLDYLAGIEYKDSKSDYLTNTINVRLRSLSREEKVILLEAVEYYIRNVKGKNNIQKILQNQKEGLL